MAFVKLSPSPSAANAQLSATSASRLSTSPSDNSAHLSAALPANGSASGSVTVDLGVLVKKLVEEQDVELTKLLSEFDDKELKAAEDFIANVRSEKWRKKKAELDKKRRRRWSCFRNRGGYDSAKEEAEVYSEIGNPALPQCYEEIKSLLRIEKNPVYAKALQEWSRKEVLLTNRVERKKSKVADLKNEIYQLIGFFSVFQGVLLTAVSQSNLLHCNNWWSPIILSVVASVVTIFGVVQKLSQIESFQKTIHSEEHSLKEVAKRVTVKNKTGITIKIREGNAGVFVNLKTLRSQQEYTLDLDANATYREYVLITLPDNTPLQQMFSSDDVAEYREITVKENVDSDPKYFWEGILRVEKSGPAPKPGRRNDTGEGGPAVDKRIGLLDRIKNAIFGASE